MIAHAHSQVKVAPHAGVGFQFVAIPAQLLRAGDLSFGAVVLLGVVADAARQNRSGLCKLSNASLAFRIGRSESEVGRYLLELEAAGLVAREFGRSKHVRLGVRLTWLEQVPESQGTASVQVPEHRKASPSEVPNRVPGLLGNALERAPQNLPSDGGTSPSTGGKEAADYLKACVAAARRGEPMPEPPGGACSNWATSPQAETAPAKGINSPDTPSATPTAPPDAFLPSVGRMVASIADRLRSEDVGRRRVSPAKLARQLAVMRRRHGRRE